MFDAANTKGLRHPRTLQEAFGPYASWSPPRRRAPVWPYALVVLVVLLALGALGVAA